MKCKMIIKYAFKTDIQMSGPKLFINYNTMTYIKVSTYKRYGIIVFVRRV